MEARARSDERWGWVAGGCSAAVLVKEGWAIRRSSSKVWETTEEGLYARYGRQEAAEAPLSGARWATIRGKASAAATRTSMGRAADGTAQAGTRTIDAPRSTQDRRPSEIPAAAQGRWSVG